MMALSRGCVWLVAQVFVSIYRLKLRPPAAWLELMQQELAERQEQEGSDSKALTSARSWLDALMRLG